ncbi:hypothetical protein BG004_003669 [Podila humilis]|nr:hypothetical protein BG004_003669 [Podila humilis]
MASSNATEAQAQAQATTTDCSTPTPQRSNLFLAQSPLTPLPSFDILPVLDDNNDDSDIMTLLPRPPQQDHQKDTILVTGGAGFIGSHTVVELLTLGKRLVIVDNLCNSSEESLHRALELADNKGELFFHKVDLMDQPALQQVFELYNNSFSCCIHFAGLKAVGESSKVPLGYYQNNITGTLNLLELLQKNHCRNFIFSSSATVYGLPTSDAPLSETSPTGATNPYGRTKQYIEGILQDTAASEPGKWNIIMLRYFNPVGAHVSGRIGEDPNGPPNNLMPFVAQVAIGRRPIIYVFGDDYNTKDGTGVRDYIHIVDLAKGHVAALQKIEKAIKKDNGKTTMGCVPYNLGTGTGYSVMEMIDAMSKSVGRTLPYKVTERRPGDVATVIADPSLSARELGWKAEKSLQAMCDDLWRWQVQNPEGFGSSLVNSAIGRDTPPKALPLSNSVSTSSAVKGRSLSVGVVKMPFKETVRTQDARPSSPSGKSLATASSPLGSPAPSPGPFCLTTTHPRPKKMVL